MYSNLIFWKQIYSTMNIKGVGGVMVGDLGCESGNPVSNPSVDHTFDLREVDK